MFKLHHILSVMDVQNQKRIHPKTPSKRSASWSPFKPYIGDGGGIDGNFFIPFFPYFSRQIPTNVQSSEII